MIFFETNAPVNQDIIRIMRLNLSYTKGSGRVALHASKVCSGNKESFESWMFESRLVCLTSRLC